MRKNRADSLRTGRSWENWKFEKALQNWTERNLLSTNSEQQKEHPKKEQLLQNTGKQK